MSLGHTTRRVSFFHEHVEGSKNPCFGSVIWFLIIFLTVLVHMHGDLHVAAQEKGKMIFTNTK